jgi:acetylornithine deacetylase/succinyl-diaminopimelate desuccinylase family protein
VGGERVRARAARSGHLEADASVRRRTPEESRAAAAAALRDAVERLRSPIVDAVSEVIRIESVTPNYPGLRPEDHLGGEGAVSRALAAHMAAAGMETDVFGVVPGRENAIGVRRGAGAGTRPRIGFGRSLILNGHVDVVPPGPAHEWTGGDPWSGRVANGRIYGRGATDMKAGLVAQVFAARALHDAQVPLVGDLVLQAVVGEEMMEHQFGTTACIERGPRADAAVVGEGTAPPAPLCVAPVTPGVLWCTIRVEGRATHASMRGLTHRPPASGRPAEEPLGVSAVDKIVLLHGALAKLEKDWLLTKRHPLFEPGHFALLPGVILGSPKSGLVPFMVPDEGRLEVVVIAHPDDTPELVREEVEEAVRRAASTDAWLRAHPPTVEWRHHWPRSAIAADHPIVAATAEAHERATGLPARVAGFAAVDDATWLNAAGIPAITYGPGDLRAAHAVDEWVDIEEVIKATRTYALLALEWCGLV